MKLLVPVFNWKFPAIDQMAGWPSVVTGPPGQDEPYGLHRGSLPYK